MFVCLFVLQASNKVEVNMETAEKLQVSRLDFMGSLNNDIKPVSCSTPHSPASPSGCMSNIKWNIEHTTLKLGILMDF